MLSLMSPTVGTGSRPGRGLAAELTGLPDEEFAAVVAESLASRRTDVDPAALATLWRVTLRSGDEVTALAGPPRLVHDAISEAFTDLALRTQARRAVLDVEMLTSAAIAQALGMRGTNQREAASRLRRTGALLGLPDGGSRGYLYPAFQVDPVAHRVHPVVTTVNRALDAAGDPWGVASWWVSPTPRLDGSSPAALVGSETEADLLVLVGAAPAGTASDACAVPASPNG